jgi:hypothetical protein
MNKKTDKERQGKLFPVFQVVRFANDACPGNNGRNGSCYTASQCTTLGGKNGGTCASGYGVCCTFDKTCGQTSSQNCTYFVAPTTINAGTCDLTICPASNNICQLRLDFQNFVITGPSTDTTVVGNANFNNLVNAGGRAVTATGQCQTDTFSVTNPGGTAPPLICGTNTGQHMYVDASKACNDLVFQLGTAGIGVASLASRAWTVKVTQYSCDYNNLAPKGCTQYSFGSTTGSVQSYNFQSGSGVQLANQNQVSCVRQERGSCRICWFEAKTIDFATSGNGGMAGGRVPAQLGLFNPSVCCGYGSKGTAQQGYDCVSIPLAMKNTVANPPSGRLLPSRFCGMMLVSANGINGNVASGTVCSTSTPFLIRGITDMYENMVENTGAGSIPNKGFTLSYSQDCPSAAIGG